MAQYGTHRIWSISEVIREIMRQNEGSPDALASCTCVSRAFSENALEVLWEDPRGLKPLFSLLSKSIKVLEDDSSLDGQTDYYYVRTLPHDGM